ncbi:uncharacterized protein LOC125548314 [Triticum urartu]|uniref:uncharacterized protein LOC125548314 n=1 Tax=Triticum urartu TaxID=4572 RepID=UPI002043BC32|nr:uncharacterized protein LOC125548314 [Triticum urartu]
MRRTGGAASASPPSASSPPAAPIPSLSSSSSPTPRALASIGPAGMAIFTPQLPCILCVVDLSSEIYNIDGRDAPPLPKVVPACATHTPRVTAGAFAGHGSLRAPAWLAMHCLPLRPEGMVRTRLGWLQCSSSTSTAPRDDETNQQKQASMEGLSRERCLCRSLALLPISAIRCHCLTLGISRLSFPPPFCTKKMTQLLGLWIFF